MTAPAAAGALKPSVPEASYKSRENAVSGYVLLEDLAYVRKSHPGLTYDALGLRLSRNFSLVSFMDDHYTI